MKKSLVFMIAVLLVGALMISCNAEVAGNAAGDGKVVTVGVNLDNGSKALQTSVTNDTNVAGLYWFYTATKTDGSLFTTGQTTGMTPVKEGLGLLSGPNNDQPTTLGDFSTGSWTFSFWGYVSNSDLDSTSNKPVYKCENLAVTITANTNLNVTIEAGEGMGAAKLVFDNPTWTYSLAPEGTSLTLKVNEGTSQIAADNTASTDSNGMATFSQLPSNLTLSAGSHTLTFNVFYGSEQVGQATLSVVAKNGTTITVSGSIENLDNLNEVNIATVTNTVATAEITKESTNKKVVTAAVTPASASSVTSQESGNNTTVTFPSDLATTNTVENTKTETSSVLTMDVSSLAEANSSFTVESGSAVAAIDLNLITTTRMYDVSNEIPVLTSESASSVTNFTGVVKVETYIAKNLTNISMKYGEAEFSKVDSEAAVDENHEFYYHAESGKLVFATNHFSQFCVTSTDEAYDVNQGKAYSTFDAALSGCTSGDTILLLKDITDDTQNNLSKQVVLDLNGKTILSSINADNIFFSIDSDGSLTIKDSDDSEQNGQINITYSGTSNVKEIYTAIYNQGGILRIEGGKITISGTFTTNSFGMNAPRYNGINNSGTVMITGGHISMSSNGENYLLNSSGGYVTVSDDGKITVSNQNNSMKAPYALYIIGGTASVSGGTIVVDDHDTAGWSDAHLAYGNVTVSGGSFTSPKTLDFNGLANKLASGYKLSDPGNNTRTVVPASTVL